MRNSLARVAVIVTIGLAGSTGRARADLEGSPAPVIEAGCDLLIELDGPVARVTETHRVIPDASGGAAATGEPAPGAPGEPAAPAAPSEAIYDFGLADGGLIDAYTAAGAGGRDEPGVLVPAADLDSATPDVLGLAPDIGMLRQLAPAGDGDGGAYEARLYPVRAGKPASFTVRWSAPMRYAEGRLVLRIPPRGPHNATNLSRCATRVVARAAGGVRSFASLYVAGQWIGSGSPIRGAVAGTSPVEPLVIEATPRWAGNAPVLATARAKLAGEDAVAVAVFVPDLATGGKFAPSRLLFVVDASRSLGAAGRAAEATIVDELLRAAPPATPADVILFDRTARRVRGTWDPIDADRRASPVAAIEAAPQTSGTDLGAALGLASDVAGDEPTRIVVVTDGVLPTDVTSADLLGHVTIAAEKDVVDVIVPVIPGAALPERGPLSALADAYHGRVLPLRTQSLPDPNALAHALLAGQPLEGLAIAGADADSAMILPDRVEPGSGVWQFARDGGGHALRLHATRGGAAVDTAAIPLPAAAARFAVAAVEVDDKPDGKIDGKAGFDLARTYQLVRADTAIVVPDRRDAANRDRAALAQRTGVYARTPPPDDPALTTEHVATVETAQVHAVGELPRMSVELVLRDQLLPQLEACYRRSLVASPHDGGTLTLELEVARGEVMSVHMTGDHFPAPMIECTADAAFALTTPEYQLGDEPDTIFVIRKPVTFRPPPSAGEPATVEATDTDALDLLVNPTSAPAVQVNGDDPL